MLECNLCVILCNCILYFKFDIVLVLETYIKNYCVYFRNLCKELLCLFQKLIQRIIDDAKKGKENSGKICELFIKETQILIKETQFLLNFKQNSY